MELHGTFNIENNSKKIEFRFSVKGTENSFRTQKPMFLLPKARRNIDCWLVKVGL